MHLFEKQDLPEKWQSAFLEWEAASIGATCEEGCGLAWYRVGHATRQDLMHVLASTLFGSQRRSRSIDSCVKPAKLQPDDDLSRSKECFQILKLDWSW
jgi:hypothetical protein